MKQTVKGLAFFIIGLLLIVQPAAAETMPGAAPVLDRLQAQCDTVRSHLSRLHSSDALLRVNVGQVYNNISSRLMARLNGRLALNKIDSTELVRLASAFERERVSFSGRYSEYEAELAQLLKIDCRTQVTDFQSRLGLVRDARHKLAATTRQLKETAMAYGAEVERIQQTLSDGGGDRAL